MKRASYRQGVAFIALNDDAENVEVDQVASTISVGLLADLFGLETEIVANEVVSYRLQRALES